MKINTFYNLALHYEFITKIARIASRLSPMALGLVYAYWKSPIQWYTHNMVHITQSFQYNFH